MKANALTYLIMLLTIAVWSNPAANAAVPDPDEYEIWEIQTAGDTLRAQPVDSARVEAADSIKPDTLLSIKPVRFMQKVDSVALACEWAILGKSEIGAEKLTAFVQTRNPDFDPQIAEAYLRIGEIYGIRGDIALCQAVVETGWFRFGGGTAVTPDQHNYCGLGVTRRGLKGHSFETIDDGVRAQLQHLYAYACREPLPEGEPLLDPRFRLVNRGVATTWKELSNRWAMNPRYAIQILDLYLQLRAL